MEWRIPVLLSIFLIVVMSGCTNYTNYNNNSDAANINPNNINSGNANVNGSSGQPQTCYNDWNCINATYKGVQYTDCSWNMISECWNGTVCNDAMCVNPAEPCTDSDGGKNYSIQGTIVKGDFHFDDYCYDKFNLREFYCEGNELKSEKHVNIPGYVCDNGALTIESQTGYCVDGDSVCYSLGGGGVDDKALTCVNGKWKYEKCAGWCQNGTCVSGFNPITIGTPNYSYDCENMNDGVYDTKVKGRTILNQKINGVTVNQIYYDEFCLDSGTLIETYCYGYNNNTVGMNYEHCNCFDGKCRQ